MKELHFHDKEGAAKPFNSIPFLDVKIITQSVRTIDSLTSKNSVIEP